MQTKKYVVLLPIAHSGRREKGEVLDLTDEDIKRISPERIQALDPEVEVEESEQDDNLPSGDYVEDEDEEKETIEHTVTDEDIKTNPELEGKVEAGETIEISAEDDEAEFGGEIKQEGLTDEEIEAEKELINNPEA